MAQNNLLDIRGATSQSVCMTSPTPTPRKPREFADARETKKLIAAQKKGEISRTTEAAVARVKSGQTEALDEVAAILFAKF